jgi:anti-anti-sigma regulatory factor
MAVLLRTAAPAATYRLEVVRVDGDRVSIGAEGKLGTAALRDLSCLLMSEVATGHVFVRIDLSAVTSIDRACVGALKQAHDRCLASQGLLLLEGLGDESRQMLAAMGLDRLFFLADTVGPQEWLPRVPRLATLVRQERVIPEQRRPQ